MNQSFSNPDILKVNDVLNASWGDYRSNFPVFISISLIYGLLQMLAMAVLNHLNFYSLKNALAVSLFISSWASVLMIEACKVISQGKQVGLRGILKAVSSVYFTYLAVTVSLFALMFLGFLAFIVPGFYLATVFMFADIMVVAERAKLTESFEKSFWLVKGLFANVFLFFLTGIFISLLPLVLGKLAALKFPDMERTVSTIIAVLVMPYFIIFKFNVYSRLRNLKPYDELPEEEGRL